MRNIDRGRRAVLTFPRDWVREHIERVAQDALDLNDAWEYLRLLEVAEPLDTELLRRLITFGTASSNSEVREAAEDFIQDGISSPLSSG